MWNALKSDLSEFVTTVKEDTSTALSNLDDGIDTAAEGFAKESLTPVQQEVERRIGLRETFTAPLIARDDTPEEEASELETYLKEFAIESKTDEIAALLEENEGLKVVFESLTSEVEYADFWQRYFYRCDPDRIHDEWDAEELRAVEARQEAVSKTIGNVTGFLGGAVKNLKATLKEGDDNTGPSAGGFAMTQNQASKAGIFASGRPPFVMNTAVDESGDDEEEEELGWDDDEDDDEEKSSEKEGEEESQVEQIEFKDPAMEKLQEQLKQAIEERDQLHQTVEMQTSEIAELQAAASGAVSPTNDSAVEKLKMELFDKEAELAALRASTLDNSMADPGAGASDLRVATLETQVERLSVESKSKDSKLEEASGATKLVEGKLSASQANLKQEQEKLQSALAGIESLKVKMASVESSDDSEKSRLEAKVEELQQECSSAKEVGSALTKKLSDMEKLMVDKEIALAKDVNSAKETVATLQAQLAAEQRSKKELELKYTELERNLAAAQRQKDESSDGGNTGKSIDTAASAVKVEAPQAAANVQDDVDGGGWDDDW